MLMYTVSVKRYAAFTRITTDQALVPKESVNYSPGKKQQRCCFCGHYQIGGTCKLVVGPIDVNYWCKLFSREE